MVAGFGMLADGTTPTEGGMILVIKSLLPVPDNTKSGVEPKGEMTESVTGISKLPLLPGTVGLLLVTLELLLVVLGVETTAVDTGPICRVGLSSDCPAVLLKSGSTFVVPIVLLLVVKTRVSESNVVITSMSSVVRAVFILRVPARPVLSTVVSTAVVTSVVLVSVALVGHGSVGVELIPISDVAGAFLVLESVLSVYKNKVRSVSVTVVPVRVKALSVKALSGKVLSVKALSVKVLSVKVLSVKALSVVVSTAALSV